MLFASIDIEVKKKIASSCGKLIDEVFDTTKKLLLENKLLDYKNFIFKLIYSAASKIDTSSFIIEINNNELKIITKEALLSIKLPHGKIKEIKVTNLANGLMLYSSDKKVASYICVNNFLKSLKTVTRADVYEILIKGKENG